MLVYIALVLIIVLIVTLFTGEKEKFTVEQEEFSDKLLGYFQRNELPTFLKYLNILSEIKNTSDNLISKSVYNNFFEKGPSLTKNDILEEISKF